VAALAADLFFEKAYEFAVAISLAFFDMNLFIIIKYKVYKKDINHYNQFASNENFFFNNFKCLNIEKI
tara:strand:- start:130 stop:333 length:204 start_codon:yes stop_codon:yes gene_type:complete